MIRHTPHPRLWIPCLVFLLSQLIILPATARTLDTAYGPVSIDGQPERVVTLHEGALDTALALGVHPVAAISTRGADGVANYISDAAGNIAIVGKPREINLEAVVAQRPDIILAGPTLKRSQYRMLAKIAPTFVPEQHGFERGQWRDLTRFYAHALGLENKAGDLIAQIQARADTLRERLPADSSALVVRWMPQGAIVMSDQVFASDMLATAGFDVDDDGLVRDTSPHSDPLSLENINRIDRDWLFLATLDADGEQALAKARQSRAFQRLDVVKTDHVVAVDGQLWSSTVGPLAAQAILDDIDNALADHAD